MKVIIHIFVFVFLTIVTQIGGIVYLISLFLVSKKSHRKELKRIGIFTVLYIFSTFLIVPNIAPIFGREKIKENENLKARSFFYKIANRNYVKPELNNTLQIISSEFEKNDNGIKVIYLDANFPFIDKFPLLPHLSHNDGKKIDVTFIYQSPNGELTNKKPSVSGYGVYENPTKSEINQTKICKEKGYWQYDFPKYLTMGRINKEIEFSKKGTKDLANSILNQNEIGKIFIEPHLKERLNLTNPKVRFHGCQAVRHDDHIHLQLK